jgi:lipid A 3-O-deacylase
MKRMGMFKIILTVCSALFFTAAAVHASEPSERRSDGHFFESSFISGIGTGHIVEGHYQPLLLIWHMGADLKNYFPRLTKRRDSLFVFLEPQFNPSYHPNSNFELGIGVGIQYRYPVTERLSVFLLGSTGPHYISLITQNQANGFIFSNTIGCGLYYFLSGNSAINLGYRFRHLSNGGFAEPNDGINVNFITLGYTWFF